MTKNIGFSKKFATLLAKTMNTSEVEAYPQKEEHWGSTIGSYQWIVVLQKRTNQK